MKLRSAALTAMTRLAWHAALLTLPLLAACADQSLIPPSSQGSDLTALERMRIASDRMVIVAVDNPAESLPTFPGTTAGGYAGAPGYIAYGSARAMLVSIGKDYGLREVTAWPIVPLRLHCAVLELEPGRSRDEVLAQLAKDQRVQLAQPLQSFSTAGVAQPDALGYVHLQRALYEIDAHAAQRVSRGNDVRVAVIDTGMDTVHPGLAGRIVLTRDFVSNDEASFNSDVHGTAVAGIIAANPGARGGILGVAPGAKIIALKACWSARPGESHASTSLCNTLTLAQALMAAIDSRARIINLSLSGPPDPLLARLVELMLKRGAIVVGAVPPDGNLLAFPVGIPRVIAVDLPDSKVDGTALRAPGRDVLTLTPGGHYDFLTGSSFSAACVSGIAALLLAVEPRLDADHVSAALKGSMNGLGPSQTVNACGALAAVTPRGCSTTATAP